MVEYFIMYRYWPSRMETIGLLAHDIERDMFAMYIDPEKVPTSELNPILFGISHDLEVTDKLIKLWIDARTIPRDRENIEDVLDVYNLDKYSAWKLLVTAGGRNPGYDNWGFYSIEEKKIPPKWKDNLVWR